MSERPTSETASERELALVELLYGEREAAGLELSAEEGSELDELQSMRGLFRQLEDQEPPARISAQLMAAATSEHAPARRASAAQKAQREPEGGGFWQWLMRPFVANPAFAAAASLMVIVGVAGALYVTGGLAKEEQAAELSLAEDSESAQPGATSAVGTGREQPGADVPASESAGALDLGDLAGGFGGEGDSKPAPKPEPTTKATVAGDKASERPSRVKTRGVRPGDRVSGGKGYADGVVDGKDQPLKKAGAEKNARNETVEPDPEPKPAKPAPPPSDDRAAKLHAEARRLARAGDCRKALRLADEIRKISSRYYDAEVAGDDALRACRKRKQAPSTSGKRRSKVPVSY